VPGHFSLFTIHGKKALAADIFFLSFFFTLFQTFSGNFTSFFSSFLADVLSLPQR